MLDTLKKLQAECLDPEKVLPKGSDTEALVKYFDSMMALIERAKP